VFIWNPKAKNGLKEEIGTHESGVKCVKWSENRQCLITGSWDKTIKFWDVNSNKCIDSFNFDYKVICMDVKKDILVVGTSDNEVTTFDLNKLSTPLQIQASSQKSQIRCIGIFGDKNGYVVGSTDGKCKVRYFDDISCNYNLDCHIEGNSHYPVNCIDFSDLYGTFATCGGSNLFNF
jgi:mRNA export factor